MMVSEDTTDAIITLSAAAGLGWIARFLYEQSRKKEVAARAEWTKFKEVEGLLSSVNEYMAIYRRLKEQGKIVTVGKWGESKPRHSMPKGMTENEWDKLTAEEQYQEVMKQAKATKLLMSDLGQRIERIIGTKFTYHEGPLKKEDRIKEKRDNDYDDDIRRVVDVVRCSVIIDRGSMRDFVDCFRDGDFVDYFRTGDDDYYQSSGYFTDNWELVRIKDGFESPDNYLSGGYRDVKLNVRCRKTGHIVEIQVHLDDYYQYKKEKGHKHYEFARQQNIRGITSAVEILDPSVALDDIIKVGRLDKYAATNSHELAQIYSWLGKLKAAEMRRCLTSTSRNVACRAAVKLYLGAYSCLGGKGFVDNLNDSENDMAEVANWSEVVAELCQLCTGHRARMPLSVPKEFSEDHGYGRDMILKTKIADMLGSCHPCVILAECSDPEMKEYDNAQSLARLSNILEKDHPRVIEVFCGWVRQNTDLKGIGMTYLRRLDDYRALVDYLEVVIPKYGIDHPTTQLLLDTLHKLSIGFGTQWVMDGDPTKTKKLVGILQQYYQSEASKTTKGYAFLLLRRILHPKSRTSQEVTEQIRVGGEVEVLKFDGSRSRGRIYGKFNGNYLWMPNYQRDYSGAWWLSPQRIEMVSPTLTPFNSLVSDTIRFSLFPGLPMAVLFKKWRPPRKSAKIFISEQKTLNVAMAAVASYFGLGLTYGFDNSFFLMKEITGYEPLSKGSALTNYINEKLLILFGYGERDGKRIRI